MKKIYIGHSKSFDYQNELYKPLRESELNKRWEIVLPHEEGNPNLELFDSKEGLKECFIMIAEVSYPATGLGIELAWAHSYGIPIICIYKKGQKISASIKVLNPVFVEYNDKSDMIENIQKALINLISE